MKNYSNLIFILLLAACNNAPKPQPVTEAVAEVNKTDSVTEAEAQYMSMGNPDTALAMFLFKNYKNFDPEDQVEEYIRWDLENEKIKPLLISLYLKDQNKDSILNILQKNTEIFHEKAVIKVLDDYKKYNEVAGPLFYYLADKKDAVVLPLIQDLLNNPKASAEEKGHARETLKRLKASK
jgi:uncharacterized membrane protein YheB (UPF0754 family)